MSSDGADPAPQKGQGELIVEIIKATYLPLVVGILSTAVLIYIFFSDYQFPYRSAALIVMTATIAAPFAVTYATLVSWIYDRRQRIPVLVVDPEHDTIGHLSVSPTHFSKIETDGSLATRRSDNGQVFIAEDYQVEQKQEVDPETGEKETKPQHLLTGTWEAEVSTLAFLESRKTLDEQRERLVPLARDALDVRAATDEKVLEGTVSAAHGFLLGAESDEFFDGDSDPLDFDLNVDKTDLDDVTGESTESDLDALDDPRLDADADAVQNEVPADE